MWDETPSSWQLRMAFPQEAKALEDIFVADNIQSLGLVSLKIGTRKATNFRIKLEDNYELILSPVDKGAEGYSEWFTWHVPAHANTNPNSAAPMPVPSIRAHIRLFYSDETGRSQIYSFTNHHENVETLIRSALSNIHHDLGLKLKPILKKRKGQPGKE
jgi:hypothetical protein